VCVGMWAGQQLSSTLGLFASGGSATGSRRPYVSTGTWSDVPNDLEPREQVVQRHGVRVKRCATAVGQRHRRATQPRFGSSHNEQNARSSGRTPMPTSTPLMERIGVQ
jgi:hypothetical protein